MPDFEIIQPEPQQPPAMQLALDRLAQQRAAEQEERQERQLWEDSQPPTLTYLGQSNGQPLLQAAGGQPFRVGQRDSNGSLLPGLADVAIGSGVVRVGGMPRVQPEKTETPVLNEKFAVLFAKTTASMIEFWLGGDRAEPIKLAEIPRFVREETFSDSLSQTLSLSGDTGNSDQSDGFLNRTEVPINSYQAFYTTSTGSAAISGSAFTGGEPDPEGVNGFWAVSAGLDFGIQGASVSCFDSTSIYSADTKPLSASAQPSNAPLPPVPAFYVEPKLRKLDDTFFDQGIGLRIAFGSFPCTATATFTASLTAIQREIVEYRAYLSITATTAFIVIGYDIRSDGLQNLLYFAVKGNVVTELEEADEKDWRRSLAIPTVLPPPVFGDPPPNFPTSGNKCIDNYRRIYTANMYQNRLYALEDAWYEPVTVAGDTVSFHEAIRGTAPVKVKLKLRTLTDAGDSCPVGQPRDLEMTVQPLRIGSEDNITFIAACAAKD